MASGLQSYNKNQMRYHSQTFVRPVALSNLRGCVMGHVEQVPAIDQLLTINSLDTHARMTTLITKYYKPLRGELLYIGSVPG